ncbi:MAG: fused MFS/spermidine synthase [Verrucomicrobia bacterium]|nr:fused MFS/spermidine synthase [Verrucomicrobiota bacterium]
MKNSARLIFATAVFCLLLSGMAGLVYEIVWARYLGLFLGHTSYAVVAVLVAFMGGLALGNIWLGTRADRSRRPLALYAWLEIGIGIYALLFPFYYDLCHDAYVRLARGFTPGGVGLLAIKFAFSLLTIVVPTILMGGTLPVLTKLVTRSLGELRARVSALYFINSLGAVVGCFLADFLWIPTIGLQATVFAGAVMNLLVGAVALFVSGWLKEEKQAITFGVNEKPPQDEEVFTTAELRLAIVGIGLSGFVAMLYEIVWTRLLALALGSSTHAFSLMLITFISGIAAGAWLVGRWKNLKRTMDAFAWAEIALAGTLFMSMFFYDLLPFWFAKLSSILVRRPQSYPFYEFFQALICFAVMLVPALCLGMTLPLVSRIATAELARTGRSVGTVFSVNTLGTVLGAAVTGLWLMPWLGMARTLAFGIVVNALVGVVVLVRHHDTACRRLLAAAPFIALIVVWLAGVQFDFTWQRAFTLGLWRMPALPSTLAEYREIVKAHDIQAYCDGAGSTVSLHGFKAGTNDHLSLRVNGKADASSFGDVATQLLLSHVPLLLHPQTRDALVIGLGSGMTCGAVLRHPTVQHLDAVEISPEVVEAARRFGPFNDHVLDNPRTRLVVEDAKSFLKMADRNYDVIISEPSNPWMAGVAGVFSREYYETCRERLATNGIMAQWVQVYETNDEAVQMVFATFTSVFPYLSVWQGSIGDLILIGSAQPLRVNLNELEQRFNLAAVKADLERMDLYRLPVFLSRELISQQNALFVPEAESAQHSDFFPALEYVAQRAFFVRAGTDIYRRHDENLSTRPTTLLARYLKARRLTETDCKAFALYFDTHRLPENGVFQTILYRWQNDFPGSLAAAEFSAKSAEAKPAAELEAVRMSAMRDKIFQAAGQEPELLRLYAKYLMQTYRAHRSAFFLPTTDELRAALERLIETDQENQRVHKLRMAELAWDRGDDAACLRYGQNAFDPNVATGGPIQFTLDPTAAPRVLGRMVESLWRAGQAHEAWELCQQAKANGYVGRKDKPSDPLLELNYRKVGRFINDSQAASAR